MILEHLQSFANSKTPLFTIRRAKLMALRVYQMRRTPCISESRAAQAAARTVESWDASEEGRCSTLFPGSQQAPQHQQLSQVVGVVIRHEQRFAQDCLAVTVGQGGEEIR